eukprot:scaffold2762_cov60-Phaeocystis_antarctica.AAC.2
MTSPTVPSANINLSIRMSSTPNASDNWPRNTIICIEVSPSDSYLVLGSTVEPVTSVRIWQAVSTAEPPSSASVSVEEGWHDAASSFRHCCIFTAAAMSVAACSCDAANSLEDRRVRATAAICVAALRATARSLEGRRVRATAAICVAASRATARSLEGRRVRATAAICVTASRATARSLEGRRVRAIAAICVTAAASTAMSPTPPAGSCTGIPIEEPTLDLQAVTAAAHHPPLSSSKAGAAIVARGTGGGTAEDTSAAASVANTRAAEGRSAAV